MKTVLNDTDADVMQPPCPFGLQSQLNISKQIKTDKLDFEGSKKMSDIMRELHLQYTFTTFYCFDPCLHLSAGLVIHFVFHFKVTAVSSSALLILLFLSSSL